MFDTDLLKIFVHLNSIIFNKKKLCTLKEICKSSSNGNIEKYFFLENTFLVYTIKYMYDIYDILK